MEIWLDAQLSPKLAVWINETFEFKCFHVYDFGYHTASDKEIFDHAKSQGVTIITKDSDFLDLNLRYAAPPQIIWLTCGNITNSNLKKVFSDKLPVALKLIEEGNPVVEITD